MGEHGSVGQQRQGPLHPPHDRGVFYVDTAFDQQFFHVTVGE
jgi:hypothetical protein